MAQRERFSSRFQLSSLSYLVQGTGHTLFRALGCRLSTSMTNSVYESSPCPSLSNCRVTARGRSDRDSNTATAAPCKAAMLLRRHPPLHTRILAPCSGICRMLSTHYHPALRRYGCSICIPGPICKTRQNKGI